MKIKATVLFQLFQYRWTFVVFYAMIVLVFGINIIASSHVPQGEVAINGTEYSTAFCLFIIGVMFTRVQFPFFLQNGISRRTTFVTSLIHGGIVTAGMTVVTGVIALIARLISSNVSTSFSYIYADRYGHAFTATVFWEGLLWNFTLNLLCFFLGLFLSILLYRLSRLLKIIVFGGLGAIFGFILPGIDITITNGNIFSAIMDAIWFGLGLFYNCNPYYAVVSFLIVSMLFAGGYYLFLRRATVKQ